MSTHGSSSVFAELQEAITKSLELASKPTLTMQEQRLHATYLAQISALKAGLSLNQIKSHQRDLLLKEAGLDREPEAPRTRLGQELEAEWRSAILGNPNRSTRVPSDMEQRANLAGTQSLTFTKGSQGGFFVPFGIAERFWAIAKNYDRLFDPQFHCPVETETGNSMSAPAVNDTSISSVFIQEANQSQEADIANFGETTLNAWTARTQKVAFSVELAMDSSQFPIGSVLERLFALRHARGIGQALVTGTGINMPTGLLTATVASGVSPIIASGSAANDGSSSTGANSIGTADLNSLFHKLDLAYRPFGVWAMNDSTLSFIEGLVNKVGGFMVSWLRDGLGAAQPFILGRPVAVSPSMPSIGAATNPIVFFDPNFFLFRSVPSSMAIRFYREAVGLVENGLIAAESFFRCDSNLITNSTQPTSVYLQCHS